MLRAWPEARPHGPKWEALAVQVTCPTMSEEEDLSSAETEAGAEEEVHADSASEPESQRDTAGPSDELRDDEPDAAEPAPFKPPGFLEAARTAFQPREGRKKAQPATGTAADAQAINFIDKRERLIAGFLAVFQILLGVLVYHEYSTQITVASRKLKISAAQARLDTINYHHEAPELLVINVVLGLAIGIAVLTKRRALVGFTILLGGLGMNASGGGIVGLVYLGVGIWLVFRSMRRNPKAVARAAAAADAKESKGSTGATAAAGTKAAGATSKTSSNKATDVRKPPPPNKRYTPPRPSRPQPLKLPPSVEPEKENRVMSWLRR